ncbi:hypothetical protein BDV18DRAFT_158889 [Aspergillus unguis]
MSTQSTPSILFTHHSRQQGFRLLELSPDLAELLSSDNPPTLELKSPAADSAATSNAHLAPAGEYVNICTPTQTYSIRQVQSSNSLHILRPSSGVGVKTKDLKIVAGAGPTAESNGIDANDEDDDVNMDDSDQDLGLSIEGTVTTIAKCGSTLELHKPAEGFSAVPFLKSLLRVYDKGVWEDEYAAGQDEDSSADCEETTKGTLERVFSDIPVSRAQCEHDWVDACAFITLPSQSKDSMCWRPSAEMKLEVWKRIVEGAVLQGIDLAKQFLVSDLWNSVLDDEGLAPFPRTLFKAVIRRICELGEGVERGILSDMKWTSIDRDTCLKWVGEVCLEAKAIGAASAVGEGEYLNSWKDQLPEAWREYVSISILPKSCYVHPEPNTICFATEAERQKVKKNLPTDTSAATAAKKTRNWHELFKNKRQKQ